MKRYEKRNKRFDILIGDFYRRDIHCVLSLCNIMGCYYDTLQSAKVVLAEEEKPRNGYFISKLGKYSLDGNLIESYKNVRQAALLNKLMPCYLSRKLLDKDGDCIFKGFRWKYID